MTGWVYPMDKRFWLKVWPRGDCWEWCGSRGALGYGTFGVVDGEIVAAHRLAYEYTKGPIPVGMDLHHLCQHPWCVRPTHLLALSTQEHIVDFSRTRMAAHARQTHCKHGHELTASNVRLRFEKGRKRPNRVCLACKVASDKNRARRTLQAVPELAGSLT